MLNENKYQKSLQVKFRHCPGVSDDN